MSPHSRIQTNLKGVDMKKLMILCAAFLLTMNASFASSCEPKFDDADIMTAVENFVASKLGGKLEVLTLVATRPYKTERQLITRTFDPSFCVDAMDRGCRSFNTVIYPTPEEVACVNSANSDQTYSVGFSLNGSKCMVNLKVVMTSGFRSFKSNVKQTQAPVCH